MADLPWHVAPVLIDDRIRLRVYAGRDLKLEIPLRSRQALIMAAQLLNHALMAERADAAVLDRPGQQDVA